MRGLRLPTRRAMTTEYGGFLAAGYWEYSFLRKIRKINNNFLLTLS
jgi:hypothetical protein